MPERLPSRALRFSGFVLDLSAYELRRTNRAIKVERRPMELLMLLFVHRRGELVTRDEIVARLWGRDVFIDVDSSVNTVIREIRRALRDSADDSRFIQTVPERAIDSSRTSNPQPARSWPSCRSRISSADARSGLPRGRPDRRDHRRLGGSIPSASASSGGRRAWRTGGHEDARRSGRSSARTTSLEGSIRGPKGAAGSPRS